MSFRNSKSHNQSKMGNNFSNHIEKEAGHLSYPVQNPKLLFEIRNHIPKNVLIKTWYNREVEAKKLFCENLCLDNMMLFSVEICFERLIYYSRNRQSQNSIRMKKIIKILRDPKEYSNEEKRKNIIIKILRNLNYIDIQNILDDLDNRFLKKWLNTEDEDIQKPPFSWMYENGNLKTKYSNLINKIT